MVRTDSEERAASCRKAHVQRPGSRVSDQRRTALHPLAVVFLVLAAQFESFVQPAIIMVSVPLALLGAIFGLKWSGLTVNIFSQIAAIMLIGIAAKNGVLIVEFANQLRDTGLDRLEAIVRASVTRLRPVLMTSLCTAFGALPLLLATGAGAEQRQPVGVVVFYGATISVFLTIFAVPVVYFLVARTTRSPHETGRTLDRLLGRASAQEQLSAASHPSEIICDGTTIATPELDRE